MSKDNANLRLLGSPVNLTYRSKKKEDRKNVRNRPRSALQNSCFTPENQEKYKRPFSADAKERRPSTKTFYKTISSELLQSFSNSNFSACESPYTYPAIPPGPVRSPTLHPGFPIATIKVVPPTAELLSNIKSESHVPKRDKDICSNASDIGSEDTFISLGTKIKHRAQLGPKPKSPSAKNLKYRNIAKRGRKHMENTHEDKPCNEYGLEVKITDRNQSPNKDRDIRDRSPPPRSFRKRYYDAYFIPLEGSSFSKCKEEDLSGRVSFGSSNIQAEVEEAIDTYSRRLNLTKQQLSLVEEESTQDIESPSQRMSSLSPENLIENTKKEEVSPVGRNTYVMDEKTELPKGQNFINEPRTYSSFYDDFRSTNLAPYKPKTNTTIILTDSSSKDSGYHDSGQSDVYGQNYSLPSTSLAKSLSQTKIADQPKSLDSTSSNEKDYKTFPLDKKSHWAEPLNHSRLLYKDFFLKKEGHVALPPQNSPVNEHSDFPGSNVDAAGDNKNDNENESAGYPSYLLNSTTKAYTSKVIEDYKKELEAINSFHELTIKDIKTDAISPTPLNIDRMFEEHTSFIDDRSEASKNFVSSKSAPSKNKNSLDVNKENVSKVSTKELIQNYLKVKEADYSKDYVAKNFKKFEKKPNNLTAKTEPIIPPYKQDWNNKAKSSTSQLKSSNLGKQSNQTSGNQTQKNVLTLQSPKSARIESIQNDRDIVSWMSLSASSPRAFEMEPSKSPEETNVQEPKIPERMATTESSPNRDNNSQPWMSISESSTNRDCSSQPWLATTESSPNRESTSQRFSSRIEARSSFEQKQSSPKQDINTSVQDTSRSKELHPRSTVLDIYSMLKEIESYGDNPVTSVAKVDIPETPKPGTSEERNMIPKDNFMEIFEFLEKVEQSANDALNIVTSSTPQTIPKLEALLKLPQTELAQRLVTSSLQLEERSCCIALLQESLQNHKEQMISKVSNLEKQSMRNIAKVKQECEETVKRHQSFIDQLINDKKTLNHRIEQLVDERRSLEERWKRSAQALEERYKLELRNQHDKMAAAQQVARQRWVRQKAEKIKELTVKGLEGELREMAERQQKEIADLKMFHAEHTGRMQAKHASELEDLRRRLEEEKEAALVKERHLASSRLEKQILELEMTYQEQRTRLVAEMRAENERAALTLTEREKLQREEIEKWKEEQEKLILDKRLQLERETAKEKENIEEILQQKQQELEQKFEQYKKDFETEQQMILKKKVTEISAQHKQERDREIEKAIESMEAEAQQGRKELQEALRRNKEQYEAELKSLAETEQATLRRYQDAQARIRQTEDRCAELEVTISQLETRNKVLTEKNIQLENQAEEMRVQCDKAWHGKVETLQREMDDMKKTHDEQMHQLYAKVKVAVARKDSAIQALTREAAKYQEKITLLESKLQQQRKDYLKQIK